MEGAESTATGTVYREGRWGLQPAPWSGTSTLPRMPALWDLTSASLLGADDNPQDLLGL